MRVDLLRLFPLFAAFAMLALSARNLAAAIPPAPAQAAAIAQGAAPQTAATPQSQLVYTYNGPANPQAAPVSPGSNRADSSRILWSNDRWWYDSPSAGWLIYGPNGWTAPAAGGTTSIYAAPATQQSQYAVGLPSGYRYAPGSTYYSYPGLGTYSPVTAAANSMPVPLAPAAAPASAGLTTPRAATNPAAAPGSAASPTTPATPVSPTTPTAPAQVPAGRSPGMFSNGSPGYFGTR